MQPKPYHYIECGLDNIWLQNGFELSNNGDLFIDEVNELHKVIGESLVLKSGLLSSKEVKYVRRHLDLSQSALGKILGVEGQTILNWEKDKNPITEPTDRLLKVYYWSFLNKEKYPDVHDLLTQLSELDAEEQKKKILLRENGKKWAVAA